MNIFYAPPEQIQAQTIELTGQEAIHASKALRYQRGDDITVVDGEGGWYEGKVSVISSESVQVAIHHTEQKPPLQPEVVLAMGIIKKRDRLEFAVEKAVELGVQEIALFRGEHTVKQNVRMDRLDSIAVSAMKQSLQSWLPKIKMNSALGDVIEAMEASVFVVADQQGKPIKKNDLYNDSNEHYTLIVGPEGGFSKRETELLKKAGGQGILLSKNRLRTETAVIALINQFNYWRS